MYVFSFLQVIILTERHLRLRQDRGGGRGRGIGQWGSAIVQAPIPGASIGRWRVGGRGAVGGRARAGAGAAVIGQRWEEGVLSETFVVELQLQVLADFLW